MLRAFRLPITGMQLKQQMTIPIKTAGSTIRSRAQTDSTGWAPGSILKVVANSQVD